MSVCRYENEQPFRRAVEDEISSLHRVIEEATMTKVDLEEQMENMRAELRSLEDNYEQVPPHPGNPRLGSDQRALMKVNTCPSVPPGCAGTLQSDGWTGGG